MSTEEQSNSNEQGNALPEQANIGNPATEGYALRLDGSAPRSRVQARPSLDPDPAEPSTHELSVLIPARNEEANIEGCLQSLLAQSEPGFLLGRQWHVFIIDDSSTDDTFNLATRIAAGREGVHVLRAPELKAERHGFTGKNAALWFAVNRSVARTAKWLLFTDADTLHEPGSTHRAVVEAERHSLGMLSYSPRQIKANLVQRALMPIVFSELASTYPPKAVSDASSPIAAANGQFLLVARTAYFEVGGHAAVADRVLEDVALAQLLKRRFTIRLRYAPEAVATRMYRTNGEMFAGWTKNLALLFRNPLLLAASRFLDFWLLLGLPLLTVVLSSLLLWQKGAIGVLWLRVVLRYWTRIRRAHPSAVDVVLSVFALPLFAYLLVRSWQQVTLVKRVEWKGRQYPQ